jgi:hypothetical protein
MISTNPDRKNADPSIHDNLDPDRNVTEKKDLHK